MLIASIDNLNGFTETISSIFTDVVHQIRNSIHYVASEDQKSFYMCYRQCQPGKPNKPLVLLQFSSHLFSLSL